VLRKSKDSLSERDMLYLAYHSNYLDNPLALPEGTVIMPVSTTNSRLIYDALKACDVKIMSALPLFSPIRFSSHARASAWELHHCASRVSRRVISLTSVQNGIIIQASRCRRNSGLSNWHQGQRSQTQPSRGNYSDKASRRRDRSCRAHDRRTASLI
jgi:hypothetical protein